MDQQENRTKFNFLSKPRKEINNKKIFCAPEFFLH